MDTFKAGNPDTPIHGIATTMMATLDLLERAARAGRNLITHEPTFFNHEDNTQSFSTDKVLEAKLNFIAKNDLVVWRFHDHWHARRPDGVMTGMAKALGLEKHKSPDGDGLFDIPNTTLEALASDMQSRLKIRVLRVVGDPKLPVRRISMSPGYAMLQGVMRGFARPDVDVVVVGETREWEAVEYAQDLISAGGKKALILLGHVLSEEAGMQECAEWLRTFVTEVPIDFIAAGEPYWAPSPRGDGKRR